MMHLGGQNGQEEMDDEREITDCFSRLAAQGRGYGIMPLAWNFDATLLPVAGRLLAENFMNMESDIFLAAKLPDDSFSAQFMKDNVYFSLGDSDHA